MRISDWSSDVCSSDLAARRRIRHPPDPVDRGRGSPWRGRGAGGGRASAPRRTGRGVGQEPRSRGRGGLRSRAGERWPVPPGPGKIGRASWRERGWQYVAILVVTVYLKKKIKRS